MGKCQKFMNMFDNFPYEGSLSSYAQICRKSYKMSHLDKTLQDQRLLLTLRATGLARNLLLWFQCDFDHLSSRPSTNPR